MKHPGEYTTVPFASMHVMQVDSGCNVKDERTGEVITVDDNTCAVKGRVIFCTAKTYEALKAQGSRQ